MAVNYLCQLNFHLLCESIQKVIPQSDYIAKLEKKAHYLEVINSFASQLMIAKTVDDVVWTIAKQAIAKLGFVDCIVYLMDADRKYLVQRAAHGPKNPIDFDIENPIKLRLGQGISGSVALTGKAEIINDTEKDNRYHVDDESRLSEITVPIILKDEVIGIIDSEHPQRNFYSQDDLDVLETIASMAATKIDQARTTENLERIVEEKTAKLSDKLDELSTSYERIKESNKEKETLLKEIHHRVKNNLQVVSSLLNLQAGLTDDGKIKEIFNDAKNRVISMSAIHEQLYEKKDLSKIDLKIYIKEITNGLIRSFVGGSEVTINFDLDQIYSDLDRSVPLGLVLNELVVNALKHAFKNDIGVLTISLKEKVDGNIVLVVSDNGSGFKTTEEYNTLGLDLVHTLAEQLNGKLSIHSDSSGTRCELSFHL
ncbi:MAG: GAF domain-containing protein [Flavobacteriales bacterium]|nr:GAF domain-containing protein [Flavobacteriales bacterium]MCB9198026.1 GAF domain-containing protein [Flavobacteriales bacterium]